MTSLNLRHIGNWRSRELKGGSKERLCATNAKVQRNVYAGLGHDPLVYGLLKD